jgi:hypothetical protein
MSAGIMINLHGEIINYFCPEDEDFGAVCGTLRELNGLAQFSWYGWMPIISGHLASKVTSKIKSA